nr:hypothetical protein BaRGS_022931 [Batillaria attramentaria]
MAYKMLDGIVAWMTRVRNFLILLLIVIVLLYLGGRQWREQRHVAKAALELLQEGGLERQIWNGVMAFTVMVDREDQASFDPRILNATTHSQQEGGEGPDDFISIYLKAIHQQQEVDKQKKEQEKLEEDGDRKEEEKDG